MKLRLASLSLVALMAVPAVAQTIYSNGAINGNTDAWAINFGYIVSDSFSVNVYGTTVTGASFGMWLTPGDTLASAELSITSSENGGTTYYQQVDSFTQSGCVANQYGFNVCTESTGFSGPELAPGTYWLNLQNASVPSGNPVYWDENSGPSSASENSVGSIPSESFTVTGYCGVDMTNSFCETTTSTTTTTSVPEPSSIMLMGSGILALAGLVRRKLF